MAKVFEGMKAYKDNDGKVWLFRPNENFKRINRSRTGFKFLNCQKNIF